MTDIFVSTQKELLTALKGASGGDRIVLADGHYGSILLDPLYQKNVVNHDIPVTVVAANAGGAVFASVDIRRAEGLSFDGVAVENTFQAGYGASDIAFINGTAKKLNFNVVDGVRLENNHIEGGDWAVVLNRVQNFAVIGNTITRASEDLIQVTRDSSHGLIENNTLTDVIAFGSSHPDMIQIQEIDGLAPRDIIIRGNYLYDDPNTGDVAAQGIFINTSGKASFQNILVEDNLVSVRHVNAIYVRGGEDNVQILHNTMIAGPEGMNGGVIRLAKYGSYDNSGTTVEGNIFARLIDETGKATIGDNVIYGVNNYGMFSGNGHKAENFLTPDLPGYGASNLLDRLLGKPFQEIGLPDGAELAQPDLPDQVYDLGKPLTLSGNLYLPEQWKGKLAEIGHVAHEGAMEIDQGTILIDFNADTLGWRRGLLSKDSVGTDNGFSAWFQDAKLHVKFEDDDSSATVVTQALKAKQDYALQVGFGEGKGQVWLDGVLVGEVATDMDWSHNAAELTIGAENSQSALGSSAKMRYAFDGDFDAIGIYDQAMTPQELRDWHADGLLT